MALNSFFLQGSANEQRLIQELINEQLKIYGVDVIYIPRNFVKRETIVKEVTSSKFGDNFFLEAYVSNYEGYSGSGDILTKFGMMECKLVATPMEVNLHKLKDDMNKYEPTYPTYYRQIIGSLMYLVNTYPDICYATHALS